MCGFKFVSCISWRDEKKVTLEAFKVLNPILHIYRIDSLKGKKGKEVKSKKNKSKPINIPSVFSKVIQKLKSGEKTKKKK